MTEEDGRAMGEALMLKTKTREKKKKKVDVVKAFIAPKMSMGELDKRYEFIELMICAVVENKLTSLATVKSNAEALHKEEGLLVGRSLAISLATALTAASGVDEWIYQFLALQKVDREYKWFRPMMEQVGLRLVGEVGWGVKLRVSMGAFASFADLVTDVVVCLAFLKEGRTEYFEMTIDCLLLSIFIRILLVILQNKKRSIKRIVGESLPVLVGLKSVVDAARVASGVKHETGNSLDNLTILTCMKAIELFAEAIPGVIIQL